MPNTDDFQRAISALIRAAHNSGESYVDINAGNLHRELGGYPGTKHAMPSCCDAMYQATRSKDVILAQPPKGKGASLTIRYQLPR
jgi:hypothetical protein